MDLIVQAEWDSGTRYVEVQSSEHGEPVVQCGARSGVVLQRAYAEQPDANFRQDNTIYGLDSYSCKNSLQCEAVKRWRPVPSIVCTKEEVDGEGGLTDTKSLRENIIQRTARVVDNQIGVEVPADGPGCVEFVVLVVNTDVAESDAVEPSSLQCGYDGRKVEVFGKCRAFNGDRLARQDDNVGRRRSFPFLKPALKLGSPNNSMSPAAMKPACGGSDSGKGSETIELSRDLVTRGCAAESEGEVVCC